MTNHEAIMEACEKIISELHDIALSLRAMSGRNVVKTGEPKRKENYADWYFGKHNDSR